MQQCIVHLIRNSFRYAGRQHRDGIVKAERFTVKDGSITLRVPIEERYLPNIHAAVHVVGAAPG